MERQHPRRETPEPADGARREAYKLVDDVGKGGPDPFPLRLRLGREPLCQVWRVLSLCWSSRRSQSKNKQSGSGALRRTGTANDPITHLCARPRREQQLAFGVPHAKVEIAPAARVREPLLELGHLTNLEFGGRQFGQDLKEGFPRSANRFVGEPDLRVFRRLARLSAGGRRNSLKPTNRLASF